MIQHLWKRTISQDDFSVMVSFTYIPLWAHLSKILQNLRNYFSKGWHLDYFKMTFLIFWKRSLIFFQRSKTVPWPLPLNSRLPKRHLQQSANPSIWNDLIWQRTKIPINFILIDLTVWCLEKLMTQKKIWQECFQIRGKLQNFWLCTK